MNKYNFLRIGIITALGIEYNAVKIMMDAGMDIYPDDDIGKSFLGSINSKVSGTHHILLAESGMGNNMSAICAQKLKNIYPSIDTFIMVGIAGAIPSPANIEEHVRLGDIVAVGEKGVVQYDLVKKTKDKIDHRFPPRPPKYRLFKAAKVLKREEQEGKFPWIDHINMALNSNNGNQWQRPTIDTDILRDSEGKIITHPIDPKRVEMAPKVFLGVIASGNTLLKDSEMRDKLRDELNARAVEMESSGIADASWLNEKTNYYAVRGTCDYCDDFKNDIWQNYAAIIAAAYTKSLLESIPGEKGKKKLGKSNTKN